VQRCSGALGPRKTLHGRVPHRLVPHRPVTHRRASRGCVPHKRASHRYASHERASHGCVLWGSPYCAPQRCSLPVNVYEIWEISIFENALSGHSDRLATAHLGPYYARYPMNGASPATPLVRTTAHQSYRATTWEAYGGTICILTDQAYRNYARPAEDERGWKLRITANGPHSWHLLSFRSTSLSFQHVKCPTSSISLYLNLISSRGLDLSRLHFASYNVQAQSTAVF